MKSGADEFVLAEHQPGAAPSRRRRRLPVSGRASTWGVVGSVLILVGVVASPGPQYPPLEDGVAWNVLDLDLTMEPAVAWTSNAAAAELVGELDDTIVLSSGGLAATEDGLLVGATTVALDARTGSERWRLENGHCVADAAAVTCVQDPGSVGARIKIYGPEGSVGPHVAHPGAVAARVLEGRELLIIEGGGAAVAELVRLDAWGGERWRARLNYSGMGLNGLTGLELVGDAVIFDGRQFDLATGRKTDQQQPMSESAHDGTVRQRMDDFSTSVTVPDGRELVVPAADLWLGVDDAFGGPVSLTQDSASADLVAHSEDGARRVIPAVSDCVPYLRLQGVLVQQCLGLSSDPIEVRLVAVDQLSGEQLWDRAGGDLLQFGLEAALASADTIVLTAEGRVEGVDPRTGQSRWSIAIPGGFVRAAAVDDGILLWTWDVVMRLG